jgi:phage terminase large subunit
MDAELPKKLGILFQPQRYKILHGGRGSGKSWGVARALLSLAWHKPMRILCARETQKSIDESVHRLLRDQVGILGLQDFFEVQENKIVGANGSIFTFAGIRQQGVVNLKSFEAVDIVWIEEAQVVTKKSWDVLIPTIRKTGSEIWLTFNPELDTDETYERFVLNPPEKSVVVEMNWQDNPWFPAELEDERIAWLKRDPVGYETVWEGKCRPAVEGAIYAKEIDAMHRAGRLCRVPYDPMLKVHTVWDLGYNDSTSIIMVQRSASEIRVIDHICDSLRPLDSYISQLKALEYNWGADYLPHDARSHGMATGKSVEEIAKALGRTVQITPEIGVEQGIQAARMMFPRCYFDKDKTKGLVNSLKRYKRAVNQTTNEPGAPLHDSSSHDADAFRYLGVVADRLRNESYVPKPMRVVNRGAGASGWMS